MPGVFLDRISKTYRGKRVIDNVTLEVDEGSFICLLGPAGGGKTTLLKIIAGLETPDSGAIYFGKQEVTSLKPYQRDVSMVFQDFALYPHMNVFKNMASPLSAKNISKSDIGAKIDKVAAFLRIGHLLDRNIRQLSGGEMQRVAIGRALAKEAKIVLFDEIFVNLDYKLREEMRAEFKALVDTLRITTIFSSPDPEDALSLADKVAVVRRGRILQYDTREIVYKYPVDAFTGSYVGHPEMNMLDCSVVSTDGEIHIDADSFEVPIRKDVLDKEVAPGSYIFGVRPEHISLHKQPQDGQVSIPGQMILTEVIGSDTIIHIDVGKHTIESFVPGIFRRVVDERVFACFDPRHIYLFNKDTGLLVTRGV